MSESVRLDSDLGAGDAEALFRGACARDRRHLDRRVAAGGGRTLWGQPSVVVLWAQRFEQTGSVAAKPSGGSTSPLEEHAGLLLGLITEQPDLTLDEVVAAIRKRGIPGSRSAVWRFFDRRDISFKKNFVRCGAKARGGRSRAPTLDAKARYV
jgi:hypothetical protein